MSLNDSLSEVERAKLAVWDYPVSDKYSKMWQAMREAGLPNSIEEAVQRVRDSRTSNEGNFSIWYYPVSYIKYSIKVLRGIHCEKLVFLGRQYRE